MEKRFHIASKQSSMIEEKHEIMIETFSRNAFMLGNSLNFWMFLAIYWSFLLQEHYMKVHAISTEANKKELNKFC